MPAKMIECFDETGRQVTVRREDWVAGVLPANLQKAWNDADALYSQIAFALQDGLAEHVVEAARRLQAIDANPERGSVMLAVTLLQGNAIDEAETVLDQFIAAHGETGSALTNLAKVQCARNDAQWPTTLRRALTLDPNFENALGWYAALAQERGGETAYTAALEEIAAQPDAWRPQMWLARHHLQAGRKDQAITLMRHVATTPGVDGDALMTVSGDLGNAGLLEEMIELVGPVYKPDQHGPMAGMNLARAMLATGRLEEGRRLVARLQLLDFKPIAQELSKLECEFAKSRPQVPVEAPQIQIVRIAGPIWMKGLEDPTWMLPERTEAGPSVGFVALADGTRGGQTAVAESENDAGRLTRSLPLYLSEAVTLGTNATGEFAALVAIAGGDAGPAVMGKPLTLEQILPGLGDNPPRYLVTGCLASRMLGRAVEFTVWNVPARAAVDTVRVKTNKQFAGVAAAALNEIVRVLRETGTVTLRLDQAAFTMPAADAEDAYLLCLGQLMTQQLCANGPANPANLWNERGILESYFAMAEPMPAAGAVMAVSGVLAAVKYDSPIVQQYHDRLLRLVQSRESAADAAWLLSPLVYRRFGMDDAAREWHEKNAAKIRDVRYHEWLSRVMAA